MKYSCKTLTHGRPHLIVEALYSFLIQDSNMDSEMIVVNDCPQQKLYFDHPRVKIFNFDTVFPSIGEKENFAIENCSGDTIITWDDDDIALSNHFTNIDKYFVEGSNLMHWNKAAFYNEPNITAIAGVGNSGIVYSKKAWLEIGKSPIENAGGDQTLVRKLKELDSTKVVHAAPLDEEISWFYRWQLPQNYHQSGGGFDVPERPNIVLRNAEYVKGEIQAGRMPSGNIQLVPKWRYDYSQMLKDFINKK